MRNTWICSGMWIIVIFQIICMNYVVISEGAIQDGNFEEVLSTSRNPNDRSWISGSRINSEFNINHVIDYLHSLIKSQDEMAEKINILTKNMEERDREDYRLRVKFSRKVLILENKVILLEQNLQHRIEDFYQNRITAEAETITPKRTRDLSSFVVHETDDRFVTANNLIEESRKSIEIFNSTLENIKENISTMENQILKFNETHSNEIITVVNFESKLEDKLQSSYQEIGVLKVKQEELNHTVDTVLSHFTALVDQLHQQNDKLEATVKQVEESQKTTTAEVRRQMSNFKSSTKRQLQNVSVAISSWKKEDTAALSHIIDELFLLQKQVNDYKVLMNDQNKPQNTEQSEQQSLLPDPNEYVNVIRNLTQEVKSQREQIYNISAQLSKVNVSQILLLRTMNDEALKKTIRPKDCAEISLFRNGTSGIYTIYPSRNDQLPVDVICDLVTDEGGWTVIQRRGISLLKPGEVREDFFRNWADYEKGFGSLQRDFWLGLSHLAALCQHGDQELRIEMTDWSGDSRFVTYKHFRVSNKSDNYRLHISGYFGTAGDSLIRHDGMAFSTLDRDNDNDFRRNCAQLWKGAWWYYACHESNLNGLYAKDGTNGTHEFGTGIIWSHWTGNYYSLKSVEMKIRNKYVLH